MNDRRRAKRRGRKEAKRGERLKGLEGIRAAGLGRRGDCDRQKRLVRRRKVEEGTLGRRKEGYEGEFECVRQTWIEAIAGSWS